MAMNPRITGSDLCVSADGTRVLRGVDVALHGGEVLGLIGANGAGKTTLLRALLRLVPLDAGTVRLNGCDITAAAPHQVAAEVAYLPQDRTVFWPLRVDRLVALGRMPHSGRRWFVGGESPEDRAAVERALARCDAAYLRHRAADTLSGGERARVLLARALAAETPALLADEPAAGLDPYHQLAVMAMFREAAAEGTGVALVSHDLALAARFCDRIVLMHDGGVLADGPPAEVLTDANLARAYGIRVRRDADGIPVPRERVGAPA